MKKDEKMKTRKVTVVIPESAYQLFKKMTVVKNEAAIVADEGLEKVSDIIRESMTSGLTAWKEINKDADKRLQAKMKTEMKALGKKKKG